MPRLTIFAISVGLLVGCGGNPVTPVPDGGGGCSGGQVMFAGVCLTTPNTPAVRTQCGDVTEFCDMTGTMTPNLACLTAAPKMRPATPATVTLVGYAHPFSNGGTPTGIAIQIFKAADLLAGADPATATPLVPTTMVNFDPANPGDPSTFRACDSNSMVGCVVSSPASCSAPTCADGLSGRMDGNDYCHLVNNSPSCDMRLRWEPRFSIANVPTNTQLVMRTFEADGKTTNWVIMDSWNVYLATDDKACASAISTDCLDLTDPKNPKYQLNANLLSSGDYTNIPNVAGLSQGISPGRGAVAGEVHDCDDIRIGNVQVGVNPPGDRFTYFNGDPYNTIPDSSRSTTGTDRLGLYSSLNIKPGMISVQAVALVGGMQVSAGKLSAVLFPNSVAVLNLNGGKPLQ